MWNFYIDDNKKISVDFDPSFINRDKIENNSKVYDLVALSNSSNTSAAH